MRNANETIGPRQVTEGITRLKADIASITAAEAALLKTKAGKLSALRREAQQHADAEAEVIDARVHGIHEDFKREVETVHAAAGKRAAHVQHAYHASKAAIAREIQETKDRRIGRVQGDIMRRRQTRQQSLDQAAADNEAFQKSLADDRAGRRDIRGRVLSSFRTFRPLVASRFDGKRGAGPAIEPGATPEKTRAELL
jgi:hypothetical protein